MRWTQGSRWAMVAMLVVLAGGLAGCSKEQQLRDENIALQTRVRMVEAERTDLEQQKAGLESENTQLKLQLAEAQAKLREKSATAALPPATARPNFGEGVEVSETASAITVTLPDAILFDSGKAALKSSSRATLDRIAGILKKDYPGRRIQVVGHTDTDPIKKSEWKDNWELSCERALAVARYLISKGTDPKAIEAAGRGEYAPRAKNDTSAGKARNRRVEIVITK